MHSYDQVVSGAAMPMRRWPLLLLWTGLVLVLAGCGALTPRTGQDGVGEPGSHTSARLARKLVVIVSDESPAFVDVANGIAARVAARPVIYNLKGDAELAPEVIRGIEASNATTVVAIGMVAASAARRLTGKRVIFCQVFNYEQAGLITPWMRGVSAVPPVAKSLHEWKALDPKLTRVGVITGGGLTELMHEARAAARENGIRLTVVSVHSDKEMLYAYKRMSPKIQGYWLLPDNRVLSGEVLRDLMSFSVKQGKQVMVFAPELLQHGGLISVAGDAQDIVTQVLARLSEIGDAPVFTGPAVTQLTRAKVQVNSMMAKELGLKPAAKVVEK